MMLVSTLQRFIASYGLIEKHLHNSVHVFIHKYVDIKFSASDLFME